MLTRHYYALRLALFILAGVGSVSAQPAQSKASVPEISFIVSMLKPHTHMLEVEVRVKRAPAVAAPSSEVLVMPVWTPGSYLVREFARHVQDFAAVDAGGAALQWEKINKNSWRIATNGSRDWKANYRVYANELSARTNQLNSDHAFWNNAALLMHLEGQLNLPSTLQILAPEPWRVATALPAIPGPRNTFRAENFDILYDSPVEVGSFKTLSFDVKGVPHRIVIDGEGNYEPDRMRRDVQKIVEASVELMGGEVPYKDYTFFLHLRATGGDGIEHLNSTSLSFGRFNFKPESSYRNFLTLVAHEYYHLWNVKRLRPDALGPFDYTKENYTKLLWVAEGITSYYENMILRRAGLMTDKELLAVTAQSFQDLQKTPGRRVMTAEEASFDSWIKFYRRDANSINSQVSYYDKGAIIGLLLDLEIRKLSKGTKSLDDVMRHLYTEFYKKDRNYTPPDFQKVSELMAGASLEAFFAKYIRGREELDYNASLAAAGLRLDTTGVSGTQKPVEKAYLGADLAQEGDRLVVSRVYAGSPAYEQGLNTGDQIVALDNRRVTREFFAARLAEKKPGDLANLTIFRFDDLSSLPLRLGGTIDAPYRIVAVDNPTAEQKQIYQSWLGTALSK
ncbi:MAG TPA: PDZ domain-containing protein [Pyrinomonadaceae bacterium]|nr:PDZ domain-containing protein [Pyrinomonadaceae bacterium]